MALKDLVSDLSAFKGQTTPDSIDNQIEKGVDFFDNETAGATGFTPKTNLETEYNKFMKSTNSLPNEYNGESTISSPNSGVRTNTKTRSAFGQNGEYSEEGNPGLSNPPHTIDSDISLAPVNQPQFTSAFMTTPIADYLSSYDPTQPFSNDLTLTRAVEQHSSTGPTQYTISAFDNTPLYENAHGTSLLPVLNQFDFTIFRERNRSSETPPFHSSVTAPFSNVALPSPFLENRYIVEFGSVGVMNLRDRYKDGSIHIVTGDSQSPIGGEVVEFASLMPLINRTSQFSTPEDIAGDNVYTVPATYPTATPQTTLNLKRENFRTTEDVTIDTFQSEFSANTMKKNYEESDNISDLMKFEGGTYKNVPSGMTENNKFGTKTYREVSDPNNFDLFRQPFILREIGNNWGFDNTPTDNPIGSLLGNVVGAADNLMGGLFRGAPTFTGLVSRNITDKFRIGKFLLTSEGIGFLGKQFILQGLNPTIESKVYNPLSVFGIVGGGDAYNTIKDAVNGGGTSVADLASGIGSAVASAFLPIGHADRYLGGIKYEDLNPLQKLDGDSVLGEKLKSIPIIGDLVFKGVNKKIADVEGYSRLSAQAPLIVGATVFGKTVQESIALKDRLLFMNPNKYLFPVSSAPKSIERGVPTFIGGKELAEKDANTAENTLGSVFNKKTKENIPQAKIDGKLTEIPSIKRHRTLSYEQLRIENGYEEKIGGGVSRGISPLKENITSFQKGLERTTNDDVGQSGQINYESSVDLIPARDSNSKIVTKGGVKSSNVDKVNMIPYGQDYRSPTGTDRDDFIKFKFHDMVNNKFIIFRAILQGISDSITPEYGEERYVGRPDKVYIYQGADRNISFGFKIYPKTAQELPILMEKLNYLVGMCYPSYTPEERMITPLISLTMGDMFDRATGLLGSLNITVEDASTWEISNGLQFPHFISAQCEFKYIGNNVLASKGKHYGINWIPDGNSDPATRFTDKNQLGFEDYPNRKSGGTIDMTPLYKDLSQPAAETTT